MSVTPEQLAKLIADELRLRLEVIVREELRNVDREPDQWVTAKDLQRRYGHSAKWWRQHKAEFEAVPDGDGPKPRLWFNAATVERVLSQRRAA